jgi:hypothetical protein
LTLFSLKNSTRFTGLRSVFPQSIAFENIFFKQANSRFTVADDTSFFLFVLYLSTSSGVIEERNFPLKNDLSLSMWNPSVSQDFFLLIYFHNLYSHKFKFVYLRARFSLPKKQASQSATKPRSRVIS